MRGVAALTSLLVGCSFSAKLPVETSEAEDAGVGDEPVVSGDDAMPPMPDAKPADFHLRIEAMIDGESYLHIKGNQLWFENRIFAAPGRWDTDGQAPFDIRPIKLDGASWLPTWPDLPNPENRDCMCLSSKTTLPKSVPAAPSTTTWKEVQVRRAQGIIQSPTAANGWELIVLISDYMVGGAAQYIVEVDTKVN